MGSAKTSDANTRQAIVIGAGIVGICSALALQEKGFDVCVIDRDGPAEGASYGNSGVISPWSCVPQSLPGRWRNVPKWLLDPSGPLAIRWSHLPRLAPWGVKFIRAGSHYRLPAIADAMRALNRPCVEIYNQLLAGTGAEELVRDCLYIHVYRSLERYNRDDLRWRLSRERGAPLEILTGGEIQEVEPELSPRIKLAVVYKQSGRTINPGRLGKVLAARAESQGARFLRETVEKIVPRSGGGARIDTGQGSHDAKTVILAAGAWSARLLAPLGVHVPLEAERGYHLVFRRPGLSLTHSIMDMEAHIVASSMEMGVRVGGAAEFAGLEAAPDYRRARVFKNQARTLLPNLDTQISEHWMGARPSAPDSVPFIGAAPGHKRIFCGFGHGHLGLTGAPMTGRMVAALAAGEPLNMDMTPYRLDRFND